MNLNDFLKQAPGRLPVQVNARLAQVAWYDVGQCQFQDSFFDQSLNTWFERNPPSRPRISGLELLRDEALPFDAVKPRGFIFHMGRCGSSILARALAQDRENLILSEPEALNQTILTLTRHGPVSANLDASDHRVLRNLILALGRDRGMGYADLFVKFTSWNVLLVDTLTSMFPEVPCLFLYRDPREVLVSLARAPAGFSRARGSNLGQELAGPEPDQIGSSNQDIYHARVLNHMLSMALGSRQMQYLNYRHLNASILEGVLNHMGWLTRPDRLGAMREAFSLDSKSTRPKKFASDVADKQAAVTPSIEEAHDRICRQTYQKLDGSDRTIVPAA